MIKLKKTITVLITVLVLVVMNHVALADTSKVNINTATKTELTTLKYVGDKIADRIIEHRKTHPFEKKEEVMQVKGVGPRIYDANKDLIVITDKE